MEIGCNKIDRVSSLSQHIKKEVSLNTNLTEAQFLEILRSRNRAGAELLYDQYSPPLFTVIYSKVHQPELAESILQMTLAEIWNNIDSYHPADGRLITWMMGIARRLSKEALEYLNN